MDLLQVISRMKQYKDDLLASCLSLVLSLPQEIVTAQITTIIPAVQVSSHVRTWRSVAE